MTKLFPGRSHSVHCDLRRDGKKARVARSQWRGNQGSVWSRRAGRGQASVIHSSCASEHYLCAALIWAPAAHQCWLPTIMPWPKHSHHPRCRPVGLSLSCDRWRQERAQTRDPSPSHLFIAPISSQGLLVSFQCRGKSCEWWPGKDALAVPQTESCPSKGWCTGSLQLSLFHSSWTSLSLCPPPHPSISLLVLLDLVERPTPSSFSETSLLPRKSSSSSKHMSCLDPRCAS